MEEFDQLLAQHPELAELARLDDAPLTQAPDVDPRLSSRSMPTFNEMLPHPSGAYVRIELPRFLIAGQLEELRGRIGTRVCVHGPRQITGILLAVEESADGTAVRLSIHPEDLC